MNPNPIATCGSFVAMPNSSRGDHRPRLHANPIMRNRLTWLMRLFPYFEEARL